MPLLSPTRTTQQMKDSPPPTPDTLAREIWIPVPLFTIGSNWSCFKTYSALHTNLILTVESMRRWTIYLVRNVSQACFFVSMDMWSTPSFFLAFDIFMRIYKDLLAGFSGRFIFRLKGFYFRNRYIQREMLHYVWWHIYSCPNVRNVCQATNSILFLCYFVR